jgi:hypothetical protein
MVRNADGRLEVFALGTDYSVFHAWQNSPGSGPWGGWDSLGDQSNISNPTAVVDKSGNLDVFKLTQFNQVFVDQRRAGSGSWLLNEIALDPNNLADPWEGKVVPILVSRLGLVRVFIRGINNDLQFSDLPAS